MIDILTFSTFITPNILIIFYYIGAVIIPLLLWFSKKKIFQKISFLQSAEDRVVRFYLSRPKRDQLLAIVFFVLLFLFLELFWRMMFEMMIGYFDIHNYLYEIAKNLEKSR